MSRKRASRSSRQSPQTTGEALRPYLLWTLAAGLWLLLAAALVSFDPADPPSHSVLVPVDPVTGQAAVHNWVGRFGAVASYRLYRMIGPGVWVLMLAWAGGLVVTAMRRPLTQPILRGIGALLMAVAVSALLDVWRPQYGSALGTGGGLVGLFVTSELMPRFAMVGTLVILLVGAAVGLLLAADQVLAAMLRSLGRAMGLAAAGPRLSLAWAGQVGQTLRAPGRWISSRLGRKPAAELRQRLTDLDDVEEEQEDEDASIEEAGEYEEQEDDDTDEEDDEDLEDHDAPGAYAAEKRFDPEALRAKIRQLPINFANRPDTSDHTAFAAAREIDLSGYEFPGLDQLLEPEANFSDEMEALVREQAVTLESALREYRIEGEVVGIDSGPVITLYEVRLAPGTKVSVISRVSSDLARALKAQNVRIVPNIVGRDTIGIEVPNLKKERVRLKELMTADPSCATSMRLPMYLGKDASGNPLIQDLTTMPHMLIAGTTGSGKSVCMNSIIMSFLFTKRPDELKLVLVDPKMVEMSLFKDVPHLMCPVVTEMPKAAAILEWATTKMDERYELLAEAGVRDVASYNELGWEELKQRFEPQSEAEEARIPKKLPYLVFIIDELADLMMTNKEVEGFIVRLAQKARAVGIHLILATQRPQANVVTGLIKGNMPCRISFKVASGLDSRIVLDQKGAELLLGQGDMLFLSPRTSKLARAQGTLVEDLEIRRAVKFLKTVATQNFEPQLVQIRAAGAPTEEGESQERDELFDPAVRVVLESRRGSVSLLQRRLSIGYSRASRLIEQMAEAGLLGDYKGSQAREVTISLEEWEAMRAQAEADSQITQTAHAAGDDDADDADAPDDEGDDRA